MTTAAADATVHASAVRIGNRAVLIRGPSGAGKSRLAFDLIMAGRAGQIAPAVLIGDDRVRLEIDSAHLMVRRVDELAGLIEIRGLGIRRCDSVDRGIVGLVVDLSAEDAQRLPSPEQRKTQIYGTNIPRIAVGAGFSALPLIVAFLTTTEGLVSGDEPADCVKEFVNHIRLSIATE
jgi:HPr kinase/phosphorylase